MNDLIILWRDAPVACMLLVITAGVSIAALFRRDWMRRLELRPYEVVTQRKWYQVFTCAFVHDDLLHLSVNLSTFLFCGFRIEDEFTQYTATFSGLESPDLRVAWGHVQFALVYFGSLAAGAVPFLIRYRKDPEAATLGASGAVSGMVTGYLLFYPTWRVGPLPGWAFAALYIVMTFFAAQKGSSRVNHYAHLWGALAGAAITLALFPVKAAKLYELIFG